MRSGGCHMAGDSYHGAVLNVGDPMPSTSLVGEAGPVELRDRIGKPLVVYFYPKDETYGCTAEACSLSRLVRGLRCRGRRGDRHLPRRCRVACELQAAPPAAVHAAQRSGRQGRIAPGASGRLHPARARDVRVRRQGRSSGTGSRVEIRFGKHVDEALAVVKTLSARRRPSRSRPSRRRTASSSPACRTAGCRCRRSRRRARAC